MYRLSVFASVQAIKSASAINLKRGRCIGLMPKSQKAKRSRSQGYQVHCRCESAGRYDCSALVSSEFCKLHFVLFSELLNDAKS